MKNHSAFFLICFIFLIVFSCFFSACNDVGADSEFSSDEDSLHNQSTIIEVISIPFWEENLIDSACMYVYMPEDAEQTNFIGDIRDIMGDSLSFNPTVISELTATLDSSLVLDLQNRLIADIEFENEDGADCFNPHHGVVLWNKDKEVIGHISLCFGCGTSHYNPRDVILEMSYFEEMAHELNLPTDWDKISQFKQGN